MKKIVLVIISSVFLSFTSIHPMTILAALESINRKTQAGEFPHLIQLEKELDKAFVQLSESKVALEEGKFKKKNDPQVDIDLISLLNKYNEAQEVVNKAKINLFEEQVKECCNRGKLQDISSQSQELIGVIKAFSNKSE